MKLTLLPEPDLSFSESAEAGEVRSPGVHLTQVLRVIEAEVWPDKYKNEISEEQLNKFAEVGFMWERVLGKAWAGVEEARSRGVLIRPGEVEKDGISCSPDAINVETWELEEYKACWRSINKVAIEDEWRWWAQIKAYCHVLGMTAATLRVLYVCGDWRPPAPQVRAWRGEFTERELQDNWAMVVNAARSKGWV